MKGEEWKDIQHKVTARWLYGSKAHATSSLSKYLLYVETNTYRQTWREYIITSNTLKKHKDTNKHMHMQGNHKVQGGYTVYDNW